MGINWQDIFYVTTSLTMVVVFILCVWFIGLFFTASKLTRNLMTATRTWIHIVDDIRYFKKGMTLKVLRFLVRILDKGG